MKAETEQIVATLSKLTKDEFYSLVGDAPYEMVAWDVEEKGPFTLENFLVNNQGLIPLEPADFLDRMGQTQPETAIGPYENLRSLVPPPTDPPVALRALRKSAAVRRSPTSNLPDDPGDLLPRWTAGDCFGGGVINKS